MSELTIILPTLDDSVQQVASAICNFYKTRNNNDMFQTIIDLQELASHIITYGEAETKRLTTPRKWVADSE